jgi:hypothetical protein
MVAKKAVNTKVETKAKAKLTTRVKTKVVRRKEVCKDWTTYKVGVATHKVGDDDNAAGGLHLQQVKKAEDGVWLHRVLAKNGEYESPGVVTLLTEHQAEARLELKKQFDKIITKVIKSA